MPTTTYKGYVLPVTGGSGGTWGDELNDDAFAIIDDNLGGIVTKTLAGSNVSLSTSESQAAILRLTGTISANIEVTTSCQGFFFVENATTGNFTVTITNGVSGTTIASGTKATLIADLTNGVRAASASSFPAGTSMLFVQTSAPTGWTKSTSHDDKALRIVSGTASSGGSTAFTSVFTSRTIVKLNLPDFPITINDPGHLHIYTLWSSAASYDPGGLAPTASSSANTSTATTGITAAFGTTARGGAQTSMDFAVQYVDAIIAVAA